MNALLKRSDEQLFWLYLAFLFEGDFDCYLQRFFLRMGSINETSAKALLKNRGSGSRFKMGQKPWNKGNGRGKSK